MGRIRPIQVTITLTAVTDDGDTLEPLNIPPITLTPAQFALFDLGEQIAALQGQIDSH